MTTIVQSAIDEPRAALPDRLDVFWTNTGGNCMAIQVSPTVNRDAGPYGEDGSYVLITDGEDVYSPDDIRTDDGVCGFYAALHYADEDTDELFYRQGDYVHNPYDDDDETTTTRDERAGIIRAWIPELVAAVVAVESRIK